MRDAIVRLKSAPPAAGPGVPLLKFATASSSARLARENPADRRLAGGRKNKIGACNARKVGKDRPGPRH